MITKEDNRNVPDSAELAVAVIADRIRRLPEDDRNDLYELVKVLIKAGTDEEEGAARGAILEILEQAPIGVGSMEPSLPSPDLQKWMSYAGARIKQVRKEAGLTQVNLAKKTGLPQSHISKLENGKHSPSAMTLKKIAEALGVPASDLDPSA